MSGFRTGFEINFACHFDVCIHIPHPTHFGSHAPHRAGPCFSDMHTVIKYGGDFLLKYKRRSLTFKNNHDNIREKIGVPLPQTKDVCVCVCVPRASLYVTNLLFETRDLSEFEIQFNKRTGIFFFRSLSLSFFSFSLFTCLCYS